MRWLTRRGVISLDPQATPGVRLSYREPDEERVFVGIAARAKALGHIHFGGALAGATILLVALPLQFLRRLCGCHRASAGA